MSIKKDLASSSVSLRQQKRLTPARVRPYGKQFKGNYNMKKTKWEPVIINIMADGSRVDDLTKYVIPSDHAYYDIIQGIYKEGA